MSRKLNRALQTQDTDLNTALGRSRWRIDKLRGEAWSNGVPGEGIDSRVSDELRRRAIRARALEDALRIIDEEDEL